MIFLNQGGYEVGGTGHLCESHDNNGDDGEGDEGLQLSSEPSWDMMQPQIKAC